MTQKIHVNSEHCVHQLLLHYWYNAFLRQRMVVHEALEIASTDLKFLVEEHSVDHKWSHNGRTMVAQWSRHKWSHNGRTMTKLRHKHAPQTTPNPTNPAFVFVWHPYASHDDGIRRQWKNREWDKHTWWICHIKKWAIKRLQSSWVTRVWTHRTCWRRRIVRQDHNGMSQVANLLTSARQLAPILRIHLHQLAKRLKCLRLACGASNSTKMDWKQ